MLFTWKKPCCGARPHCTTGKSNSAVGVNRLLHVLRIILLQLLVSVEGCIRFTSPPPTAAPTPPAPSETPPSTRIPIDLVYVECRNQTLVKYYCLNGGECRQSRWDYENSTLSHPFCHCHPNFMGKRCHDRYFDPSLIAAIVGTPLILFLLLLALILVIVHRKRRNASSSSTRASCDPDDDEDDRDGDNHGVEQEEEEEEEDDDDDAGEELVAKGQKRIPLSTIEIKITDHDEDYEPGLSNGTDSKNEIPKIEEKTD